MQSAMTSARRHLLPYWFLAPALLVELAIILYPVLQTAWMSLHDYVLFRPNDAPFIALGNFIQAAHDPVFWLSLGNSLIWIVGGIFVKFGMSPMISAMCGASAAWKASGDSARMWPMAMKDGGAPGAPPATP